MYRVYDCTLFEVHPSVAQVALSPPYKYTVKMPYAQKSSLEFHSCQDDMLDVFELASPLLGELIYGHFL